MQRRLKVEFESIADTDYEAGRRGGASDAIRRRANLLPSYTVGQALAAFHGDPVLAYDKKSEIWVNDTIYAKHFNQETSARHIVFAYSLLRNVLARKALLISKYRSGAESLKDIDIQAASFFEKKASAHLFVSAIASCMETVLDTKVANRFDLEFKKNVSASEASMLWDQLVEVFLPLIGQLSAAFSNNRARTDLVKDAVIRFQQVVGAVAPANKAIFQAFATQVRIRS